MPKTVSALTPTPLGPITVPVNGDPMDAEGDIATVVQKLLNMMAGSIQTATPAGTLAAFAGVAAPDGWLLCDGQAVSRTTYASLYAVLGTRHGAGNGSTTFNLPDLRGRVVLGAGQGTGLTNRALGTGGGAETHSLTIQEMPSHSHSSPTGNGTPGALYEVPPSDAPQGGYDYIRAADTANAGGNGAHNNMQPWMALNYIIRW